MTRPPSPTPSAPRLSLPANAPAFSFLTNRIAVAGLLGAILLAYANTFSAPFIFDDKLAITGNPSIREIGKSLLPSLSSAGANGRPLVNLSLAINYAIGGLNVTGYHIANLIFHAATTLVLFGLVRRTLELPLLRDRFGSSSLPLAFLTALVWAVHPLLTESVTFIVQRNESMVALCYLLVFYCQVRANDSPRPIRWFAGSFVACVLGMLCKEVMVSAPLLAVFYQVIFIDGSWGTAWQKRRNFFLVHTLSWIPLFILVANANQRDGTVGFGLGVAWWEYALTQCRALIHYLKLVFVPYPLVLDYGTELVRNPSEVWLQILALAALLTATLFAVLRKSPAAFPALCFWALLAPSSSILPLTTQTMAEHRMYLPLAGVIVLLTCTLYSIAGRRSFFVWVAASLALLVATLQRNHHYRSEVAIWQETLKQVPNNPRAYANLAGAFVLADKPFEAELNYQKALQLKPDYDEVHTGLASLLEQLGRRPEAIVHYIESIRLNPKASQPHYDLGNIYSKQQRWAEAAEQYEAAAKIVPESPDVQSNLGNTLVTLGRHGDAVPHLAAAVRAAPENSGLRFNLANALAYAAQPAEAIEQYEKFLTQQPAHAEAHFRLGALLAVAKKRDEAIAHYQSAIRLSPDYIEAHFLLGIALMQSGKNADAMRELEIVLRLRPDFPEARLLLEKLGPR